MSAPLAALWLVAGALAGGEVPRLDCRFDTAAVDGRAAFDSALRVKVAPLSGQAGLARLVFSDGRIRAARMGREGVWMSFRTAPDLDDGNRVEILDVTDAGRAVLVTSAPGQTAAMVSREGRCTAAR